MSTRAHIRIFTDSKTLMYYHHSDGYPEHVGKELKSVENEIYEHPENLSEILGLDYEETNCLHGDEVYVYIIDCRDKTIKCFSKGLNDSFENCFKAEREVIIPK